jgi:hypothetical protein
METKSTQRPDLIISPLEGKSDEEKLREIIKKYSHQTKIYNEPRKFWWESEAYSRYNR